MIIVEINNDLSNRINMLDLTPLNKVDNSIRRECVFLRQIGNTSYHMFRKRDSSWKIYKVKIFSSPIKGLSIFP